MAVLLLNVGCDCVVIPCALCCACVSFAVVCFSVSIQPERAMCDSDQDLDRDCEDSADESLFPAVGPEGESLACASSARRRSLPVSRSPKICVCLPTRL